MSNSRGPLVAVCKGCATELFGRPGERFCMFVTRDKCVRCGVDVSDCQPLDNVGVLCYRVSLDKMIEEARAEQLEPLRANVDEEC